MTVLIAITLTSVLVGAGVVVFTRDPARQAVVLGVYGLLLTVFFMVLQAPDVALSQLAVGTAVTPLMVLLTVRKVTQSKAQKEKDR
ncbi:Na(+)/H(+) antiporter subunit B [Gryllotalpicola reticulitermitis]|uniref:Na(+)/H(+) antiporter subunit B n=1 Tax=Gryllotalpicola reticulitermitis TaxID=1184153 RepID=A0ABV8Q3D4_9MICO